MVRPSTLAAASPWLLMTLVFPYLTNGIYPLNINHYKYNSCSPQQHPPLVDLATDATSKQSLQWSESTSTSSVVMPRLVLTLRAGMSTEPTHRGQKEPKT